jgi:hypothetical protein
MQEQEHFLQPSKLSASAIVYKNLSKKGYQITWKFPWIAFASIPKVNMIFVKQNQCRYATLLQKPPDGKKSALQISSGDVLLKELNKKHSKTRFAPILRWLTILSLIAFLAIYSQNSSLFAEVNPIILVIVTLFVLVLTLIVQNNDSVSKSTVIYYKIDNVTQKEYQSFFECFKLFASSQKAWSIEDKTQLTEWKQQKRQGGAGTLIERHQITPAITHPPYIQTNIAIPSIPLNKNETLYFFPDRILSYSKHDIKAISYQALTANAGSSQFIESDAVPSDATIVGQTWRFVNKDGGPDRRFKNNAQVPITKYGTLTLDSPAKINCKIQTSWINAAAALRDGITKFTRSLNNSE